MARTTLDLVEERIIDDRAERRYRFDFPVTDPADVRASLDGTEVLPPQMVVEVSDDGGGGLIRFQTATETREAVALAGGETLRIWRDTTLAADTDLLPGAQELATRPALSTADVAALVRSLVADWAEAANAGAIPADKLSNATVAALDPIPAVIRQAAIAASLTLSGNDLIITSDDGTDGRADLRPMVRANVEPWAWERDTSPIPATKLSLAPGRTEAQVNAQIAAGVLDWAKAGNTDPIPGSKLVQADRGIDVHEEGSLLGRVTDLDFVGMEMTLARVGSTGTLRLHVPPPGLNQAQVDARVDHLVEAWALQAGMDLFSPDLGNVRLTAEGDQWAAHFEYPSITWHLDTVHTYDFTTTRTPPVTSASGLLGLAFTLGDGSAVDLQFRNARYDSVRNEVSVELIQGAETPRLEPYAIEFDNAAGESSRFLVAEAFSTTAAPGDATRTQILWRDAPADTLTVGNCKMRVLAPVQARNYAPTAGDDDLPDWVLTLNNAKVPIWKEAPAGTGGTGGLTQAQVDNRIAVQGPALIADWAETSNTDDVPLDKLPDTFPTKWSNAVDTIGDQSVVDGVKAWARSGGPIVPDNQIPASIARDTEIATWARSTGPTGRIPAARALAVPTLTEAQALLADIAYSWTPRRLTDAVNARVQDWARDTTTSIPASKLGNAPQTGGADSAAVIKTKLEGLTGTSRLLASAIQGLDSEGFLKGIGPLPATTGYTVGDAWLEWDATAETSDGIYVLVAGTPNTWEKAIDPRTSSVSRDSVLRASCTLPTATVAEGALVFPANLASSGWTIGAGANTGRIGGNKQYSRVGGNMDNDLGVPVVIDDTKVWGFWLVCKVAGTEVYATSVTIGASPLTDEGDASVQRPAEEPADRGLITLFFAGNRFGTSPRSNLTIWYQMTREGFPSFQLRGDGTGFPANSTIEVYEAGTFPQADVVPDEWEVLTQAAYDAIPTKVAGKIYFIDG